MDEYIIPKGGNICWHLDKIPFNEEVKKKAEVELNERPEEIDKAIEELRIMINEKADFITRTDNEYLLRYLRARKFDCKRAYTLLRNYYLCLSKYSSIFEDFRPSAIKDFIFRNVFTILPYRDPEGRVVAILRLGEMHPERTPFHIAVRIIAMGLDTIIQNPVTQVHGLVVIVDFHEITLRFFTYVLNPRNAQMIFCMLQDCFPGRLKTLHTVFGPNYIRMAMAACRFFMSEKMRRRFVFHGYNMKSLHEYIPPEILPEEYGGTLHINRNLWPERLVSMEQYFTDLFKQNYE